MKKEKILFQPKPYDEKLALAAGRGGRKIVGAVWTLYPSGEFVEEIIRGNEQMLDKKQLGQAEAESPAHPSGPDLWDSTSREK
jgi:hypothetical protein